MRPAPSSQWRVCWTTGSPDSMRAIWRSASYSMARPSDRTELRFLISHRVPNGSSAAAADRHVGVDPHRPLLHLAVGGARGHQDGPQLGHVGPGLVGRAHVGALTISTRGTPERL